MSFKAILKTSRLVQLGLAAIVGGLALTGWANLRAVPSRASLETVSGTMVEGKQVTRNVSRKGVMRTEIYFQVGIADAKGQTRTVLVDSGPIGRGDLEALMQKPVVAEVDGGNWAMAVTSQGKQVLAYETVASRRDVNNVSYRLYGPQIAFGGLNLLVVGYLLRRRSLKREAASGTPA